MARYTPPKSVSKNRKDKEESEEEQEEAPEEEQEDTRSRRRTTQAEQPEIETELLKYLIKNGFLNGIQVTMSFEQLLNTIEKMSG